jgi:hypothetical protein
MADDKSQMTNSPSLAKATEGKLQKGAKNAKREDFQVLVSL